MRMAVTTAHIAFLNPGITEQAMELNGGMGVIQGMPIEKYVRDAHVQKHISFPPRTRFKITEQLAGYQRQIQPLLGEN